MPDLVDKMINLFRISIYVQKTYSGIIWQKAKGNFQLNYKQTYNTRIKPILSVAEILRAFFSSPMEICMHFVVFE